MDKNKISELVQQENPSLDQNQSKEILKDLLSAMEGKDLFKIEKEIEKDHYLVSLKKEAVKEIGLELIMATEKYATEEQKEEYAIEVEKAKTELPEKVDQFFAQVNGIEFEVWITDSYLSKIKWQNQVDLTQIEGLQEKVSQGTLGIIFEVQFSNFNKKFNIEAPTEVTPIEDLISLLFSAFIPQQDPQLITE